MVNRGDTPAGPKWLHLLADAAKHMAVLRTFSLKVDQSTIGPCYIPQAAVITLVKGLPASLRALEIDTLNADYISTAKLHLCASLAPHLRYIKHLRLRTRFLCPSLFRAIDPESPSSSTQIEPGIIGPVGLTPKSALETAILIFGYFQTPSTIKPIYHRAATTKPCLSAATQTNTNSTTDRARLRIAEVARRLTDTGAFPALKVFKLVEPQDVRTAGPGAGGAHDELEYRCFKVGDVMKDTTTTMPWRRLWHLQGESVGQKQMQRLMQRFSAIRTPEGEVVSASLEDLSDVVEGECWTETLTGERFPGVQRDSRVALENHTLFKRPELRRVESVRLEGVWDEVWRREEVLGRETLGSTVVEGLGDIAAAKEVLPVGWALDLEGRLVSFGGEGG